MRWQNPWPLPEPRGTYEQCLMLSLEELYKRQKEVEDLIEKIRDEEPPNKRKYEKRHRIWFGICQDWIEELQEIRDAISEKKSRP